MCQAADVGESMQDIGLKSVLDRKKGVRSCAGRLNRWECTVDRKVWKGEWYVDCCK